MTVDDHLESQMANFRETLLEWYTGNRRKYPWRETDDPFRVLIAEIMLRRTKADQVEKVYNELFAHYPTAKDIVSADEEQIENIVYPLGLRWRSTTFKLLAMEILNRYGGEVPQTRESLLLLPGTGEYVAGAVLSIAYNKREWLVDTNVVRVLTRYFGISTSKEGRRDKRVINMAKKYVSQRNPRDANLAILDFSAIVCISRKPKCSDCPLNAGCQHYRHRDIKE